MSTTYYLLEKNIDYTDKNCLYTPSHTLRPIVTLSVGNKPLIHTNGYIGPIKGEDMLGYLCMDEIYWSIIDEYDNRVTGEELYGKLVDKCGTTKLNESSFDWF